MADIKVAEAAAETPDTGGDEELELVTEGFIKYNTLRWEWWKCLGPWQGDAVKALLHPNSLTDDHHPLRTAGDDGMTMYKGRDAKGRQSLSLSLRQVQYLQYYIHEMRLADPVWVTHLAKANTSVEGEEAVKDVPVAGPEYPEGQEWIPIPDKIIRKTELESIETVKIPTPNALKKILASIKKHNKAVDTVYYTANPSLAETYEQQALVDKASAGPGFRRGSQARLQSDAKDWKTQENENVGWGGFSLSRKEEDTEEGKEALPDGPPQPVIDFSKADWGVPSDGKDASDPADSFPPTPAPENTSDSSSDPLTPTAKPSTSPDLSQCPSYVENFSIQLFGHAQQALTIAALGGLFNAQLSHFRETMSEDDIANLPNAPPVGRSLFIALSLTTWEADEEVVLELGWAAVWWQEKPGIGEGEKFQEMRDRGHYIVQDHVLSKSNGTWQADNRSFYLFDTSTPVEQKNLKVSIEKTIKDLQVRAGGGSTFVIVHSADMQYASLDKVGLPTRDWYRRVQPSKWEYPCYACLDGLGKTFVMDTAMLFAAIEHDPCIVPAPLTTTRSLEDIAWTMFGEDEAKRPTRCGNAGNDAFYNLEVFLAIVTGPSLESLREDFRTSQKALADAARTTAESIVSNDEPLTPDGPDGVQDDGAQVESKEESDEEVFSDDEMIKGVFFDADDGTVEQLE